MNANNFLESGYHEDFCIIGCKNYHSDIIVYSIWKYF